MSERYLRLGITPEYFPYAQNCEGVFRKLGWPQPKIDSMLKFGAEFNGKPEDLYPQFLRQVAEPHGIDDVDVGIAESWLSQVNERGIENMPPIEQPAGNAEADAKRLKEIQDDMAKPRGDSKYWKDPAMRDEYLELLERAEAGSLHAATAATPDAGRKAEIEQIMKSDRARYHSSGMDKEYLAILQSESGEVVETTEPQTNESESNEQST